MKRPAQRQASHPAVASDIAFWLIEQGLEGASQEVLLEGFCTRLLSDGIPIQRVHVAQRAFHPEFGGIGFRWSKAAGIGRENFARSESPLQQWRQSPFYHMLEDNINELRVPLAQTDKPSRFPLFDDLRANGGTEYFAKRLLFAKPDNVQAIDPNFTPEGIIISWTSDAEDGFSDSDIDLLRKLLPSLGLSLKSASNRQMAHDLLATYVGADAGQRVLSGDIQRGSFETINAVIWYFDLQGFTKLSETITGAETIAMLNEYFGAAVAIVEEHGGNVLKFMGDGMLAIFTFKDSPGTRSKAIDAAIALRKIINEINLRRESEGLPQTGFNLALHAGDVLYGNIGAKNRLDFTVIGSAVNTTARILGMCNPLEQNLIISSKVARAGQVQRDDLISLGRYMLRGISEPQELYTHLDSEPKSSRS
ncbi:MAG: adenylate/guanylate cyclase domain-containing protein [Rhizobiaceae bacterium]|nr:adenylate/guanylate cyclase domain-containing protein [Rhizobiaceae bacterium]